MWAEQAGLCELALRPDDFWSLLYREFVLKWDGFLRAEKRREWLIGRHALLTASYKKTPGSVERLLGWGIDVVRYPIKPWL